MTYSNVTRRSNTFAASMTSRERILRVDRHQLAPQRVVRRVNRDREAELLRAFAERDDARQHAHRRDGDVPRADAEPGWIVENA